jgi:hypothetical protein
MLHHHGGDKFGTTGPMAWGWKFGDVSNVSRIRHYATARHNTDPGVWEDACDVPCSVYLALADILNEHDRLPAAVRPISGN